MSTPIDITKVYDVLVLDLRGPSTLWENIPSIRVEAFDKDGNAVLVADYHNVKEVLYQAAPINTSFWLYKPGRYKKLISRLAFLSLVKEKVLR